MIILKKFNSSILFAAFLIASITACSNGDTPVEQTNDVVEDKGQISTTFENNPSLPPSAKIEGDDQRIGGNAQSINNIPPTNMPTGDNSEAMLDSYYARQGDADKIKSMQNSDDAEKVKDNTNYLEEWGELDNSEINYSLGDEEPSPTQRYNNTTISYYKSDGAFYNDRTHSTSSLVYEGKNKNIYTKTARQKKAAQVKINDEDAAARAAEAKMQPQVTIQQDENLQTPAASENE